MRNRQMYRGMWLISMLVIAALACNFVSRIGQASDMKKTADALIPNAEAYQATMEVMTTDLGVQLTDIGAEITESGLMETVQAVSTDLPGLSGEKPEDIPVMKGDVTMLNESDQVVAYMVDAEVKAVVDFYETEMVANGWSKVESESANDTNVVTLVYSKDSRKAYVVIAKMPMMEQVSVTVSIQ